MGDTLLIKTLVMIIASACAVGLLARVRLPAAVGYLVAGLAIGPHGFQLLAVSDETQFLAGLGVIFLMFMAGLECSLPAMIAAYRGRQWEEAMAQHEFWFSYEEAVARLAPPKPVETAHQSLKSYGRRRGSTSPVALVVVGGEK